MKKIAFKNFRRFQDFPTLELGNISIMVGRNNSGKSTMVKALLLVLDYLQNQQHNEFSFTNKSLEDANIVTFGRAKNNKSDIDEISFDLEIDNFSFSIIIYGNNEDTNANVASILIKDIDLSINYDINYNEENITITKLNKQVITKFDSLNDLIKEIKELEIEFQKDNFNKKSSMGLRLLDRYNFLNEKVAKLSDNLTDDYENDENDEIFSISYPLKLDLENRTEDTILEELISDFLFINDAELRKLKEIRNNYAHGSIDEIALEELVGDFFEDEINVLADEISLIQKLEDKIQELVDLDNYKSELMSSIRKAVQTISTSIVYYLGANPSKQSALFSIRDKHNNLAQAIHDFKQSKILKGEKEYDFVKYWMKEFEVGQDFNIEFYAGEAYEFYVFDKEGFKAHLADKGMGSLQAMMLILRVATIMRKHKKTMKYVTIIVEEPELNLHPALQSKLASFFHTVNTEYGIEFIIETHSEYLIRKAQLFVAENEYTSQEGLNPNPFSVNYFDVENGPYQMNFTDNGKFDRNFGEGFYDEAAKNTMALIQKQRKKD
jgi:predicted ATPase